MTGPLNQPLLLSPRGKPPYNNVSQVPNGTISSGSVCYSNNTSLTASGVAINGTANVQLYSGGTIQLLPGFSAGSAPASTPGPRRCRVRPAGLSHLGVAA